jgi:hypothetical protein
VLIWIKIGALLGNKVKWEVLGVWRRDMDGNEDTKLFLKDAGKTAEETVERVRGFEENYHYLLHRMMLALPWLDGSVSETLRLGGYPLQLLPIAGRLLFGRPAISFG